MVDFVNEKTTLCKAMVTRGVEKYMYFFSLMGNPVTAKPYYRLYIINKVPALRVLDFRRIKDKVSFS